jgi:dienelactone hydrolase
MNGHVPMTLPTVPEWRKLARHLFDKCQLLIGFCENSGGTLQTLPARKWLAKLAAVTVLWISGLALAVPVFAQHRLRADLNEEIITIPASIHDHEYHLETTLFRPNKVDRFPLIVIAHGTNKPPPGGKYRQPRDRSIVLSETFVRQGFAVAIPNRRGYGSSDGDQVRIKNNDLTAYGLENALDIQQAIRFLAKQPYVDPNKIIICGFSTGGLAALAYLSHPDNGVLGVINFHGGVRPHNFEHDPVLTARIDAFVSYAKTTHLPSLWFYTANDHSSRPQFRATRRRPIKVTEPASPRAFSQAKICSPCAGPTSSRK